MRDEKRRIGRGRIVELIGEAVALGLGGDAYLDLRRCIITKDAKDTEDTEEWRCRTPCHFCTVSDTAVYPYVRHARVR